VVNQSQKNKRRHDGAEKANADRARPLPETNSCAMNLFRGQIKPDEVFPFRDGIIR